MPKELNESVNVPPVKARERLSFTACTEVAPGTVNEAVRFDLPLLTAKIYVSPPYCLTIQLSQLPPVVVAVGVASTDRRIGTKLSTSDATCFTRFRSVA